MSANSTARRLVRLARDAGHGSKDLLRRVKRRIQFDRYPTNSWYWPLLEKYRNPDGLTLEESEFAWMRKTDGVFTSEQERTEFLTTKRWMSSPRPAAAVDHLVRVIEAFHDRDQPFTYLEFGACFGTTISQVMGYFRQARGIAVEVVPAHFDVVKWMIQQRDSEWDLQRRVDLFQGSILDAPLAKNSIDVVFMDTNHVFPDEYEYILHLVNGGYLRKNFLFVGDDPLHTGTDKARLHFIENHGQKYKVITRSDYNLWWFFER